MGAGTSSSGSAVGAGAGFSGDAGGGAGYTGVASSGGFGADAGVSGTSTGGGVGDLIKQLMQDPQLMKEISGLGSKLGALGDAQNKLSPQTRSMLAQVIGQSGQRSATARPIHPFAGDITSYITPDVAARVLQEVGIPTNRMSRF